MGVCVCVIVCECASVGCTRVNALRRLLCCVSACVFACICVRMCLYVLCVSLSLYVFVNV